MSDSPAYGGALRIVVPVLNEGSTVAARLRALVPLRRAMWLWSISWCVKWRALSSLPATATADGEDWAAEGSDAALIAHVRERVDHYLSAGVVGQVLEEFDALEKAWRL